MVLFKSFILVLFIAVCVIAPPPNRQSANENVESTPPDASQGEDLRYAFPYSKYFELVAQILEADQKFQEKMKNMKEHEIKAGDIADHIDDLDKEIFDKLTSAKLKEIKRLQDDFHKRMKEGNLKDDFKMPEHLDTDNLKSFGKEDLRKLIKSAVADMARVDEDRRQKFKEYEMRKKAEEEHRLAQMPEDVRKKALEDIEEVKRRRLEHEKVNHPGGREQLEEVWEKKDHLEKDTFDPETFFNLHDFNQDGMWNTEEVDAIFQNELEKLYNESDPSVDLKEKAEEMYKMREHVVAQMDLDKDGLISRKEFLTDVEVQAKDNKDQGWEDIAEQKIYTDDELKAFEYKLAQEQGWGEQAYVPHPPAQQQQQHETYQGNQQPIQPIINGHLPPPPDSEKLNKPVDTANVV